MFYTKKRIMETPFTSIHDHLLVIIPFIYNYIRLHLTFGDVIDILSKKPVFSFGFVPQGKFELHLGWLITCLSSPLSFIITFDYIQHLAMYS